MLEEPLTQLHKFICAVKLTVRGTSVGFGRVAVDEIPTFIVYLLLFRR